MTTAKEFAAELVPIYVVEGAPASGPAPLDIEAMMARLRDRAGAEAANRVRAWLESNLAKGAIAKEDLRAEIADAVTGGK